MHSSERTSMMWEVFTTKEKDALRWEQPALPSSNPKRRSIENWLANQTKYNSASLGSSG